MKNTIKKHGLALVLLSATALTLIPQASSAMARVFVGPKTTSKPNFSEQEKKRIDAWLAQNKLNSYGDPEDTMYAGGTPLFNERTGTRIDRYDYLVKKFPKAPWKQKNQSRQEEQKLA
jgi:hypothetical protein